MNDTNFNNEELSSVILIRKLIRKKSLTIFLIGSSILVIMILLLFVFNSKFNDDFYGHLAAGAADFTFLASLAIIIYSLTKIIFYKLDISYYCYNMYKNDNIEEIIVYLAEKKHEKPYFFHERYFVVDADVIFIKYEDIKSADWNTKDNGTIVKVKSKNRIKTSVLISKEEEAREIVSRLYEKIRQLTDSFVKK